MKLFVTVGAQMPFDRFVSAMDAWAAAHPEHEVFAQIGESSLLPAHMQWTKFVAPDEFGARCEWADVLVGHAGIGTLFAALERGKRVLVMPRHSALRETRNDHQIATAREFGARTSVWVAWDDEALDEQLNAMLGADASGGAISSDASPALIRRLADFIDGA